MNRVVALLLLSFLAAVTAQTCVNGLYQPDTNICECYDCWTGATCAVAVQDCVLPVETNQAYVCEEYWTTQRSRLPVVVIDSVYRTSYQPAEYWVPGQQIPGIAGLLVGAIRQLHQTVGNVRTEGYSIALGHGGSQLIQAAFYAYAKRRGAPQEVYASSPFYYLLPYFANTNPGISIWRPDITNPPQNFIEFMISPNNPNGAANQPRFGRTLIHDAVFKWPLYTNDYAALDRQADITIFSLSKVTGHSGSRMGWAIVQDPEIARLMNEYIYITTHGVTIEAQYRAYATLAAVNADSSIFSYTRSTLISRWDRILALFNTQSNFVVESQRDFCLIWIQCVATPDNCVEVFRAANLRARGGREFGGTNYIRLNMMVHNVNFDSMITRLQRILSATPEELTKMAIVGAELIRQDKETSERQWGSRSPFSSLPVHSSLFTNSSHLGRR